MAADQGSASSEWLQVVAEMSQEALEERSGLSVRRSGRWRRVIGAGRIPLLRRPWQFESDDGDFLAWLSVPGAQHHVADREGQTEEVARLAQHAIGDPGIFLLNTGA